MAQITKILNVDVAKKNRFQALVAKQYDSKSRYLNVRLQNEGVDIEVETSCTVVMNALRADGASKGYAGSVNEDGTVTVPITSWMLALDDTVECDISVIDASARKLTTMTFEIEVQAAAYGGAELAADESYDLLTSLMADVANATEGYLTAIAVADEAAQRAEEAAESAESAASAANEAAKIARSAASGTVKSVNGKKPDENGNVSIETGALPTGGRRGQVLTIDEDGTAAWADPVTVASAEEVGF